VPIVSVHVAPDGGVAVSPLTFRTKLQPFAPMYSMVPGAVPCSIWMVVVSAVVVLTVPQVSV
jgi:hypothetical protein